MKYQNTRGGHVKLQSLMVPPMEFGQNSDKGDALTAMEMVLGE
jgi:ferritin heavy chain